MSAPAVSDCPPEAPDATALYATRPLAVPASPAAWEIIWVAPVLESLSNAPAAAVRRQGHARRTSAAPSPEKSKTVCPAGPSPQYGACLAARSLEVAPFRRESARVSPVGRRAWCRLPRCPAPEPFP